MHCTLPPHTPIHYLTGTSRLSRSTITVTLEGEGTLRAKLMAAPQQLAQEVLAYTRVPLSSAAHVGTFLVTARRLATVSDKAFPSPWDLAKVLSAVLRCTLQSDAVPDLRPIAALGLECCPVTVGPAVARLLQQPGLAVDCDSDADPSRIARELTDEGTEHVVVILSLLNAWHRWECLHAGADCSRWSCCSTYVEASILTLSRVGRPGAAALRLSPPPGSQGQYTACRLFSEYWVGNLFTRGCRGNPSEVVAYLDSRLSSGHGDGAEASACLAHGLRSPLLCAQWQALRAAVLQRCRLALRSLRPTWVAAVKDVLQGAFAQEPNLYAEHFYRPMALTAAGAEALCALLRQPDDSDAILAQCSADLLAVRRVGATLAIWAEEAAYGVAAPGEYEWCARPLAVLALQTGQHAQAAALLKTPDTDVGTGTADAATRAWVARLLAAENSVVVGSWPEGGALAGSQVPTWSAYVSAAAEHLSLCTALDVLVTSSDAFRLRAVCDICLRHVGEMSRDLLHDPLALPFLCRGLAHLVSVYVRAGDAPLARFYLSTLGMCVTRGPTRVGVLYLRCAMGRFARLLSRADAAMFKVPGPSTLAYWQDLAAVLPPLATEVLEEAVGRASPPIGTAFDARRAFFRPLTAVDTTVSTEAVRPFTVVTVQRHEEDVCVERQHHDGVTISSSVWRIPRGAASVSQLHRRALAVIAANGEQLVQQAVTSPVATAGAHSLRDVASPGSLSGVPSAADVGGGNPTSAKELWWAERFRLDHEMHSVVCLLEDLCAYARPLFCGELPASLSSSIRAHGDAFLALLPKALREEAAGAALHGALPSLLLGLPFLAPVAIRHAQAPSPKIATVQGEPYPVIAALYDPAHLGLETSVACTRCAAMVQEAADNLCLALEELFRTPQRATSAGPMEGCRKVTFETHREELSRLCVQVTVSVLGDWYGALKQGGLEPSGDGHVDLLLIPRGHVHLLVEDGLHAIPFEGMDVLRDVSASRIPSLSYVRNAHRVGAEGHPLTATTHLRHTYILMDSSAVKRPEAFHALLRENPLWSMDLVGEPSSTANGRSDSLILEDSPLLPRMLARGVTAFVYLGHKRGETHLSRGQLYDRSPASKFPLVLLMGCRSAQMFGCEGCDAYGMPWAFLHAGASAFVGCLWDVTDGEIDRLTRRFMKIGKRGGDLTVGEWLSAARRACKLPFLSGICTAMFGVNDCRDPVG